MFISRTRFRGSPPLLQFLCPFITCAVLTKKCSEFCWRPVNVVISVSYCTTIREGFLRRGRVLGRPPATAYIFLVRLPRGPKKNPQSYGPREDNRKTDRRRPIRLQGDSFRLIV